MTQKQWDKFIIGIIKLESEAHRVMLLKTAHALNEAKNIAGYERVEALRKQSKNVNRIV
jgi:hypothetical protein